MITLTLSENQLDDLYKEMFSNAEPAGPEEMPNRLP